MSVSVSLISYSAAAVAYLVLSLLLLTRWRNRARGSLLIVACVVASIWAMTLAYSGTRDDVSAARILLTEFTHDSVWLIYLSSLLGGAIAVNSNWLVRRGGVVAGLTLLLTGVLLGLESDGLRQQFPNVLGKVLESGSIVTSLFALVGIEQLYRNARPAQQRELKFLCLGLAGIFVYDIFLYSNAVLTGRVSTLFWDVRGFVVVLCVPLIATSFARIESWQRGIFASRQIVLYTTTLFASGVYLSLVVLAGYYIRTLGKEWGDVLQLVFFSAAMLGFFALVLSERLRRRIKVFLVRNFFERKYDYRAEWLRLGQTLTGNADTLPLKKRAVKALAQIIGSSSGMLWLSRAREAPFEAVAGWDTPTVPATVRFDGPLPAFLAEKGKVIDVAAIDADRRKYAPLTRSDLPDGLAEDGFVVPLLHEARLMGFVFLSAPQPKVSLDHEDYDLLKTAGQQIASYLAQAEATDRLAESRQFEAYSRFTAFVMHDLKNAIAQQSLVVENARKHRRNPEFVDDAMETIEGSVNRMRRVLEHLKQGIADPVTERVDVSALVRRAKELCSDRQPVPAILLPDESIAVQANFERLLSSLTHAVRNAQDACRPGGSVSIEARIDGGDCLVAIGDTGCGMDAEFVRERLFRPFDSTKGAEGMGIGAYQIRETAIACGGDVEVVSEVGSGTVLTLRLPVVAGKNV